VTDTLKLKYYLTVNIIFLKSNFYLINVKLLEKLVILVNKTSSLVNGQLKKLVTLINGINTLVNGQMEIIVLSKWDSALING